MPETLQSNWEILTDAEREIAQILLDVGQVNPHASKFFELFVLVSFLSLCAFQALISSDSSSPAHSKIIFILKSFPPVAAAHFVS